MDTKKYEFHLTREQCAIVVGGMRKMMGAAQEARYFPEKAAASMRVAGSEAEMLLTLFLETADLYSK